MNNKAIIDAIVRPGILPLFYHDDASVSLEVCKALYKAGIRAIEYTNRGENALTNFRSLQEEQRSAMPDLLLGIGTIKSESDADKFLAVGADFIISPGVIPVVGSTVHAAKKLWIPGCLTTTEIMVAEQCGASFIKLFPGNLLGPGFVSSIKDIFPTLNFMPTGGVDTSRANIEGWLKSGVSAVGMGSKLISKELMEKKNYGRIEQDTKDVLGVIESVRKGII